MLKLRYKNPSTRYTVHDVDGATLRGLYNDGTRWNTTTGLQSGVYPESFRFVDAQVVDVFGDCWRTREYHRVDEITDGEGRTVAWVYYSLRGDDAVRLWNGTPVTLNESRETITRARAREIGDTLNVDWSAVDLDEFHRGMNVELEHTDVTDGDPVLTAKIALAHLDELPDYYTRLAKMEAD